MVTWTNAQQEALTSPKACMKLFPISGSRALLSLLLPCDEEATLLQFSVEAAVTLNSGSFCSCQIHDSSSNHDSSSTKSELLLDLLLGLQETFTLDSWGSCPW